MLDLAATTPSSPLASKVVVVDMRVSPLLAEWRAQAPFYTPVPALFQDNTASSCSCANLDLPHLRIELRAVQRWLEHSRVDVSQGRNRDPSHFVILCTNGACAANIGQKLAECAMLATWFG